MSEQPEQPEERVQAGPRVIDEIARSGVRVFHAPGPIALVIRRGAGGEMNRLVASADDPGTTQRRLENLIEKESFEQEEKSGTPDMWSTPETVPILSSRPDTLTGVVDPINYKTRSTGKCAKCGLETTPKDSSLVFGFFDDPHKKTIRRAHIIPCSNYNSEYDPDNLARRSL